MELSSEIKLYAECSTGSMGNFARAAVDEHDRANKAEAELAQIKQIVIDNLQAVARVVVRLTEENRKLKQQLEFEKETNKVLAERLLASVVSVTSLTSENELLKEKITKAFRALTE